MTGIEERPLSPTVTIKPTVGRHVNFWPNGKTGFVTRDFKVAMLAEVFWVQTDREVGVIGIDHDGNAFKFNPIILLQPGDHPPPVGTPFVAWMDYQIEQATA